MSDLARIADALERIADHLAPIQPKWMRATCEAPVCTHFATGPSDLLDPWTAKHEAESGHRVSVVEDAP